MRCERRRASLCLIVLISGALASCIDMDRIDESVQSALRQTFDRLDQTVGTLSGTLDAQRTKLAQDTQALLDTTLANLQGVTEQVRQSLDTVLAAGRNVDETITAELGHTMASLTVVADGLVGAVKIGADDTIRNLVKDFERQRTATLRQINGLVQGAIRPTLAQLTLVGDHFVGRFTSAVNVWIVRGIGGLVIGLGVICFVLAALRTGGARRALVVVGGISVVAGGALVGTAALVARLGAPEIAIPSGDAVCREMIESSAALQAALPAKQAAPGVLRTETAIVAPAPLAWPGSKAPTGTQLRSLLKAHAGPPLPAGAPRTPAGTGIASLAKTALQDASRCITYATSTQMADLAAAKFAVALSLISDTLMCRESADCSPIGKVCDTSLGVCLARGVYCDGHGDCDLSKACADHRCVLRDVPCVTPSACRPEDSCDPGSGRCVPTATVAARHQACHLASLIGPCATGELRSIGRMVTCVQTTLAQPEACDGIDNNCNGTIDEGLATAERCVAPGQRGECANGHRVCQNGGWACVPATATVEVCDGKDNDCDGAIDELPPGGPCNAIAVGECRSGTMGCRNGRTECIPRAPAPEVCDGKDNDCNGACDEGATCAEELVFEQLDERHGLLGLGEEHEYGDACGKDAYGRQRIRTRCEAKDDWDRAESHCEPYGTGFGGWTNSDDTSCRCKVHFGSRNDAHVRCRVKLYARPVGCIGNP